MKVFVKAILFLFLIAIGSGCVRESTQDGVNYRKAVDKDANFVGQGLTIRAADEQWNWFLPDVNSTAQLTAISYEFPPDDGAAEYLRSFVFEEDMGFVWRWEHDDLEIYLLYVFLGSNGYFVRTLHNVENITVDEAILATYFEHEYNFYLDPFRVEKWEIYGVDDDYGPESLDYVGANIYHPDDFTIFEDRIVTLEWTNLVETENSFCLNYRDKCLPLPEKFLELLSSTEANGEALDPSAMIANIKVRLSESAEILEVLGGALFQLDPETGEEIIAVAWPVAEGYLGAGASPFNPVFD